MHGVPELLAPAGSPEAFNVALAAGADAIYCGLGNNFNARRSADNFTDDEFAAACRRAHLAGARVYVTVNVAVATGEMPMALALIRRAWVLGADAIILQDWGLMSEVRRLWPQIECHVSTQANVHDARGVAWCRDVFGACRVTVSRELSLLEISRIAEVGVEIECFAHGALCFCYSGVCLMSSMAGNRSANRGLCAQPCRLPYELVDEAGSVVEVPGVAFAHVPETHRGVGGVRLLCPKDLCTIDRLSDLADAGVASLKVEGRMKAPDYVLSVVSAYRKGLNALASGADNTDIAEACRRTLKRAFNRDFTCAYLDGRSDNEMMSYERSNNRGEVVGEVVASRALEDTLVRRGGGNGGRERMRRLTQAEVDIALVAPVGKGDLLELRPIEDPSQFLTALAGADAVPGERIRVRAPRVVTPGAVVRVIRSEAALAAAARVADKDVVRRREVRVLVRVRLGEPLLVSLETVDGQAAATATGPVVEPARTRSVTREDLIEHVGRMGTSPFAAVAWEIEIDKGAGMSFSDVHKVRALACCRLEEALLAPYAARVDAMSPVEATPHVSSSVAEVVHEQPCVCALVTTAEAAEAALSAGATRIYATPDDLACGLWPTGMVPWLDEVCRECDHERLDAWVRSGEACAVGNVSELALAAEREALPEIRSCIPIHNDRCLAALVSAGAAGVWLSGELTLEEVSSLSQASTVPIGLVVYGRDRVMTSEHCVLQALGRCVGDCERCEDRVRRFRIRNIDGELLEVRTDVHGRSRIFSARVLDATPEVAELLSCGVRRLLIDGQVMDAREVACAVRRVVAAVAAVREGRRVAPREAGSTSGHLFSAIG